MKQPVRLTVLTTLLMVTTLCLGGCGGGGHRAVTTPTSSTSAIPPTTLYPAEISPANDGPSLGDLDGDGDPSVGDAIKILRIVVGLDSDDPCADANQSGQTDVGDAIKVLRCVVGLDTWPIGACGEVGQVSGRVTAPSAEGIGGVRCYIDLGESQGQATPQQADNIREDYTDADGYFTIENVPAGNHALHIQAGAFSATRNVSVQTGKTTTLTEPIVLGGAEQPEVKMAVVEGGFDSVETLLEQLGFPELPGPATPGTGWVLYWDVATLLNDPTLMAEYGLIFVNCGGLSDYQNHAEISTWVSNLKAWLAAGGRLYVSDWESGLVEAAFPNAIDWLGDDTDENAPRAGEAEEVAATILAPILQQVLGKSTMTIDFNMDSWVVMAQIGPNTQELVRAEVTYWDEGWFDPVTAQKPVMVQFSHGEGVIIYTSFHYEAQQESDMLKILRRIALGGL